MAIGHVVTRGYGSAGGLTGDVNLVVVRGYTAGSAVVVPEPEDGGAGGAGEGAGRRRRQEAATRRSDGARVNQGPQLEQQLEQAKGGLAAVEAQLQALQARKAELAAAETALRTQSDGTEDAIVLSTARMARLDEQITALQGERDAMLIMLLLLAV